MRFVKKLANSNLTYVPNIKSHCPNKAFVQIYKIVKFLQRNNK